MDAGDTDPHPRSSAHRDRQGTAPDPRRLRRLAGDARAAELARVAAQAACERPEGRPLFAGHAALAWPDEPHLVLWHAQTLLREFRGDGHVAALVTNGLSGIEALVTHAASGDVPPEVLRSSRAWPDEAWSTAVEELRARGLIEAGGIEPTADGRALRQRIEDATDAASVGAYRALGEDGCAELRALARGASRAIVDSGGFGIAALRAAVQ